MTNYTKNYITIAGQEIPYYKVDHDVNGNPRYVIHFLDLGIEPKDYGKIEGMTKYRAKWFGGGYVIQSYNLSMDLQNYYLPRIKRFYEKGGKN